MLQARSICLLFEATIFFFWENIQSWDKNEQVSFSIHSEANEKSAWK